MRILDDKSEMPFGMHCGKPMEKVPAKYLDWLHGELGKKSTASLRNDQLSVLAYIEKNRELIDTELEEGGD